MLTYKGFQAPCQAVYKQQVLIWNNHLNVAIVICAYSKFKVQYACTQAFQPHELCGSCQLAWEMEGDQQLRDKVNIVTQSWIRQFDH